MIKISYIFLATILIFSCGQKNEGGLNVSNILSKPTDTKDEKPRAVQDQFSEVKGSQTYSQQADSLIIYYKKAKTGESKQKYDKLFFDAFPSTFKGMQNVFGYDDDKGAAPLYDYPLGNDVIKYFSTLTTIPKDEYYHKYVNICVGGAWEADNIKCAFGFAGKLLVDTKAACSSLDKLPDKEIKSVFRFIFDGPHPDNKENRELYNSLLPKVSQQKKRLGELLTASYFELIKEDDGHGH